MGQDRERRGNLPLQQASLSGRFCPRLSQAAELLGMMLLWSLQNMELFKQPCFYDCHPYLDVKRLYVFESNTNLRSMTVSDSVGDQLYRTPLLISPNTARYMSKK